MYARITISGTATLSTTPSEFNNGITITPTYATSTFPLTFGLVISFKNYRVVQLHANANQMMYRIGDDNVNRWSAWTNVATSTT